MPPGSGSVLAIQPTKYAITITRLVRREARTRGSTPTASRYRSPTRRPRRAAPGSRLRTSASAVRTPCAAALGTAASRRAHAPAAARHRCVLRATSRSKSPGSSDTTRNTAITAAPKIAGTIVIANGADPGQTPEVEPEAVDHQRDHVDAVEQGQEGDHPRGDEPRAPSRSGAAPTPSARCRRRRRPRTVASPPGPPS